MKVSFRRSVVLGAVLAGFAGALLQPAAAQEKLKIGFVFFLSGPGAAYGSHARDGAKLVVEALNAGKVPAPYDRPGINGLQIEPVFVDEAGSNASRSTW
jgi:branched-chain amino acid transport system substrate-binding protein